MTRYSKNNRRGFTLVELIVVVGLMGLLATISIGGYFAAARGMAARGVVQDTASLIRQAMQTCLIDQVPTAVLFLNQRQNKKEEGGKAFGRAVAIKMAGRISYVAKNGGKTSDGSPITTQSGSLLIDEFADWNQSYSTDSSDKTEQRSIRLYRIFSGKDGMTPLEGGLKKCSSLMCAWVGYKDLDSDYMINAGNNIGDWCKDNKKTANDNKNYSETGYDNANSFRWGLPFHPKNNALGVSDWRIGDAYGVEIGSLDLPLNYIYGSNPPKDTEVEAANSPSKGVLVFMPGKVKNVKDYQFNIGAQVKISVMNDIDGNDCNVVGTVDDSMLEDQK